MKTSTLVHTGLVTVGAGLMALSLSAILNHEPKTVIRECFNVSAKNWPEGVERSVYTHETLAPVRIAAQAKQQCAAAPKIKIQY